MAFRSSASDRADAVGGYPVRLGFIGLDSLGRGLVRDLARRTDVESLLLFDDKDQTPLSLLEGHVAVASSIAEVAHCRPDIIGISVRDESELRRIVTGPAGLLATGVTSTSIIVIHSIVDPDLCVEMASHASIGGVFLIDAPIIEGPPQEDSRRIRFALVGAESRVLERCRHYLEALADVIEHAGDLGAGQQLALLSDLLVAANVGLAQSIFAAAPELDVRRAVLQSTLTHGGGFSYGVRLLLSTTDADDDAVHFAQSEVALAERFLQRSGIKEQLLSSFAEAGVVSLAIDQQTSVPRSHVSS